MYFGACAAAPVSMKSKSSTRFSAATATTNRLKAMPSRLASWITGTLMLKKLSTKEARYTSAMPPVAANTPILNFSVTLITPLRYSISSANRVPKVSSTAWNTMPGNFMLNTAEIAPRKKPSTRAYIGAVTGDHSFLNTVTSARISPPTAPPMVYIIALEDTCP